MRTTQDDGGPAFPLPASTQPNGDHQWQEYGMSLRDWFAGMALQGIIAKHPPRSGCIEDDQDEQAFANGAYAYADAMLSARKEAK